MSDRSSIPTINDVARAAGVSKGLVSFVFNDRPGVAPETETASGPPTRWAGDPAQRPLPVHPQGLRAGAGAPPRSVRARGRRVLSRVHRRRGDGAGRRGPGAGAECGPRRGHRARHVPDSGRDHRVDGVFLTDLRRHDSRLPLLTELGLPAVTLGRPDLAAPFCVVEMDDTSGIARPVDHLRELGHRRIAHVAGDPDMLHGRRRRHAFVAPMAGCGLDPTLIDDTDFSAAAGALPPSSCSTPTADRRRSCTPATRWPWPDWACSPPRGPRPRRPVGRRLRRHRHRRAICIRR